MKKFVRGMSIFLAAVLSVAVFAACDSSDTEVDDKKDKKEEQKEEKVPTIEEIWKVFDEGENGKVSLTIRSEATEDGQTAVMTIEMVMEEDGDAAHAVYSTILTLDGEELVNESEEMYLTKDETTRTTYTRDEVTGKWIGDTEDIDKAEDESAAAGYAALFDAKYYNEFDKSTGRYTMKEGEKITMTEDGQTVEFTDCYIEYKNGSYTVFGKYSTDLGATVTLTLTCSGIGKTSVKLPAEISG